MSETFLEPPDVADETDGDDDEDDDAEKEATDRQDLPTRNVVLEVAALRSLSARYLVSLFRDASAKKENNKLYFSAKVRTFYNLIKKENVEDDISTFQTKFSK